MVLGVIPAPPAQVLYGALAESSWRTLLFWLGPPGLVIAGLCLLTLDEPRKPAGNFLGDPFASSKFTNPATRALNRSGTDRFAEARRCLSHSSIESCLPDFASRALRVSQASVQLRIS